MFFLQVIWVLVVVALVALVRGQLFAVLNALMGGKLSRGDSGSRSGRSTHAPPPASYSDYYGGGGGGGSYYESYNREREYQPSRGYASSSSYSTDPRPSYPSNSGPTVDSPRGYQQHAQSYPTSQPPPPPVDARRQRIQRTYSKITDDYTSLDQVTDALSQAGLESSNLIVGIDFTKSNEWTGKLSFNRKSLHHIGDTPNPYEQALSIIGRTLSSFDEDNLIPCYGFGDASTHDQDVFSFYPDGHPCDGFEEALSRYREITPYLKLAGPTSFAPIIEMAMTIVEESGGQYHVLLIIADGQVTRSVDADPGQLSPQEQSTQDAIVRASEYALSIVLVGVGDGPWDTMKDFDDNIPSRAFDNFQFVNYTDIMLKNVSPSRKETDFALSALMEIPSQYKATLELGLLGHTTGRSPRRIALPTPRIASQRASSSLGSKAPRPKIYEKSSPSGSIYDGPSTTKSATSTPMDNTQMCPVCLINRRDMAFTCGHQTCCDCGLTIESCPICRAPIGTRIKLY